MWFGFSFVKIVGMVGLLFKMQRCVFRFLSMGNNKPAFERTNNRMNRSGVTSTDSKLILYGDKISPPVRFALMTATVCNVELKFQKVNLFESEHKTEQYKKINPLHKVPALKTEKGVIIDSHAIALYLSSISDNAEIVCPADPFLLAKVQEMLFFNSSVLFPIDSAIFTEFFQGKWPVRDELLDRWYLALDFLETQLCAGWLVGNKMTLCDLCCSATVTSLMILVPLLEKHVNIQKWIDNLQKEHCFIINRQGIRQLNFYVDNIFKENKVK